jgi:polar amino acid transport system substrate-binding protein
MQPDITIRKTGLGSRGFRMPCFVVAALLGLAPLLPVGGFGEVAAQAPASDAKSSQPVTVPSFWDPRHRPERPDMSRINLVRFITEVDYPPFNYAGTDGNPVGFNVDLARLICEDLKVACTIQMRRFDTLIDALNENRGDAAIASMAVTAETRKRVDFSDPYYRPVARFVALRDSGIDDAIPEHLEAKKIAVVAHTAQEAYLRALFTEAEVHPYPTAEAARDALQHREVDLLFDDGFALAFWLNGTESADCCAFVGGPYSESRYFGEGVGIAVKRGNDTLRQSFNWSLFRLWEQGHFADLWLRYFPISPF